MCGDHPLAIDLESTHQITSFFPALSVENQSLHRLLGSPGGQHGDMMVRTDHAKSDRIPRSAGLRELADDFYRQRFLPPTLCFWLPNSGALHLIIADDHIEITVVVQ